MDKGKRISRESWIKGGAELAEELRAMGERAKLARARAVIWAQTFRHAPPWPGREESDLRFSECWKAFERESAMPQRVWEPDPSDPCAPSDSPGIPGCGFDHPGVVCDTPAGRVSETDRDILLAWLGTGSPVARRVMAWLLELDAVSASAILGDGL